VLAVDTFFTFIKLLPEGTVAKQLAIIETL